jgi:hypothetical protein
MKGQSAARLDTGSQQIAGLMRDARPEAFADAEKSLERSAP